MSTLFVPIHVTTAGVQNVLRGLQQFSSVISHEFACHVATQRRLMARVASTFFVAGYPLMAQTFAPTTAPIQNWVGITSSADGGHLVAVASYGYLFLSIDSGASWTRGHTSARLPEPQRPWQAVASSADGSKVVAIASFNPIFCSADYGKTWSTHGPAVNWAAVASSADGAKLVAVDYDLGGIYTSTDSGLTWTLTSAPTARWRCVASSADGTRLIAGTDYGADYDQLPAIYTSADSGTTWTLTAAPREPWQSLTCSEDGTEIAAAVYGGLIYVSKDAGEHWAAANVPRLRWSNICSSGHFTRLVAAAWEGPIYFSGDSGVNWSSTVAPESQWQALACTFDGSQAFAGIWDVWGDGGIYSAYFVSEVSNADKATALPAGPTRPSLDIKHSAGAAIVSWASTITAFQLQQSSAPNSSQWTDVPVEPQITNARNQVVIPDTDGNSFFRLISR